jgi:hypothetical protein
MTLFSWLRKRTATSAPQPRLTAARFRPQLESLEDRLVPSTLTVTSTADSGPGTLRAEITAANPGDTIVFANNLFNSGPQTITLSSGELLLNKSLTIDGPGAGQLAISGGLRWGVGIYAGTPFTTSTSSRVFEVTGSSTNVTLSGLTITDGCPLGTLSGEYGPNGGAIANHDFSTLTVSGCTVSNNYTTGDGGGIYNFAATLKLVNSTLSGNLAENSSGGSEGGGLYSNVSSPLSMTDCTLSGNVASEGGGVWLNSTTMTVNGCTFTGNVAYGSYGEDIYNAEPYPPKKVNHNSPYPLLTVCDSVFTNYTQYAIGGPWTNGGGNTFS